ncbi:GNAT family N-acetyltransferase [Streptomyces sp. NPDC093109]|uniref:GNAT family N-acetyltransferase n=1 Tax=Streptomyces sp. NPDC093109 TaxID=3154977 RepID=UPI00344C1E9D
MSTLLSTLPIRPLTMGDLTACADLAEDRGWAREEHKWSLLLAAGTGYGITDPDDPDGKRLAATCVVTPYGTQLAGVGMMLVAGQHARKGLGRRLMTHVLHEANGTPLMLHATSYGRPLYQQLGFKEVGEVATVAGLFCSSGTGTEATTETPDDATEATEAAVRAATAGDLPAVIGLDTEVFGVDRTSMIARLPAFADRLSVAEEDSALTGYAARWPTAAADVIGPLIARDTRTAKALISSLITSPDRPIRIHIDVRHQELLSWVKEHGLEQVTLTTVMVHGIPDLPGDRTRHFAPLNMATG